MARFHNEPMGLLPTALYTLIDLSSEDLQRIQQACESECVANGNEPNSSVRIAPQPTFAGQPLQAVLDYHTELSSRAPLEFNPHNFITVTDEDWQTKGVLLVTLDDDDLECNTDSFYIKAADAGLSVLNILVGNSDWTEQKENYELQTVTDEDDGSGDENGRPLTEFYVPIYIHSQLQPKEVLACLEPLAHLKTEEEYMCRIQASLNSASTTSQDLVAQAVALHPLRCAKAENKWLNQTMLVVVDTADPNENGMVMCRLDWEGLPEAAGTSPHTEDALTEMGATLARSIGVNSTMRIPYRASYGIQNYFLAIGHGDQAWPSEAARRRPKFGIFQYKAGNHIWLGAEELLSGAPHTQEFTQEQLIYDKELEVREEEEFRGTAEDFDDAVRRFPMLCRENRLVENLDTTLFICVDREDIVEAGVLLVRRRWDSNVWGRTNRELMSLEIANVCSARVPIGEAISILSKGREGNVDGMTPDLVDFFS